MTSQLRQWRGTLPLLIGLAVAPTVRGAERTPEETVHQYIRAVYSRNYAEAYRLISDADKQYKSPEEYLRENVSFSGAAQKLADQLASYITYGNARTEIHGDRATVVLGLNLPDGNDPKLRELFLDFEEQRLEALSEVERQQLAQKLREANQRGELPYIFGEERFELVREAGGWKLFLNWARAVLVRFTGEAKMGLPWEFEPVQAEVRALPGEILRATYRVKNLTDNPDYGKARLLVLPTDKYLDIIQCFCFIRQTLEPGEERELTLLFRVRWDVPRDVKTIEARYEFYPLEHFEQEWERSTSQ
ncbi:MAG: cytochrome c oxidase assembly protein [Candidatus Methylomirabilales bacterium]